MAETLLLNKSQISSMISMDMALVAVEEAYRIYAHQTLVQPDIVSVDIPKYHGEVDLKTCYSKEQRVLSIKSASGFWKNTSLPNLIATITLLDGQTGSPLCLMDGSLITGYRTGAAGGLSAKLLSRTNASSLAIIGCGQQARMQLRAIKLVRNINNVYIYSRCSDEMIMYKKEMENELDVSVMLCDSVKVAVENADIIVTTTPSTSPLVYAEWVRLGTHIIAVGADAEGKQELDTKIMSKARVYGDSIDQCLALGELRNAIISGDLKKDEIIGSVGDLLIGRIPGRLSDAEITVFDTTGMGIQDTTLSVKLYEEARLKQLGSYYDFLE